MVTKKEEVRVIECAPSQLMGEMCMTYVGKDANKHAKSFEKRFGRKIEEIYHCNRYFYIPMTKEEVEASMTRQED